MMDKIARRMREQEAFTLIELMVVVLIIGILIAIALPTFLGARQRAQNRAAQSDLRNGIAAAKTFYTDSDTFTDLATDLANIEPSLVFAAAASASPAFDVSFAVSTDGTDVGMARLSASGTCYYLTDRTDAGDNPGTWRNSDSTAPVCTGAQALTYNANDGTW